MKKKTIIVLLIIVLFGIFVYEVKALQNNFTFSVNPEEKTVKAGETVEIELKISDITSDSNGICAVQGKLSYSDEKIVESVSLIAKEGWTAQINEDGNSKLKGTFIVSQLAGVTKEQTIATLKVKIKSDISDGTTSEIYLKDVFSSYANQGTVTEDDKTISYSKTIKLKIENEKKEPETNTNVNTNTETKPETNTNINKNTNTETKLETKNNTNKTTTNTKIDNTIAKNKIAQTGRTETIGTLIVLMVTIGVIAYIGYKRNF